MTPEEIDAVASATAKKITGGLLGTLSIGVALAVALALLEHLFPL